MNKILRTLLVPLAALLLASGALAQDAIFITVADTHSAYDAYPHIITAVQEVLTANPDADTYVVFNGDLFELGALVPKSWAPS